MNQWIYLHLKGEGKTCNTKKSTGKKHRQYSVITRPDTLLFADTQMDTKPFLRLVVFDAALLGGGNLGDIARDQMRTFTGLLLSGNKAAISRRHLATSSLQIIHKSCTDD